MIIGAFYWAMLFFGGIVLLISGIGVFEELQQHTVDAGGIGFGIAFGIFGAVIATYSGRALLRDDAGFFGVRSGPLFGRTNIAGRGCLFVILVVGSGLVLYGPLVLVQLPGMLPDDQLSFGVGAAVSFVFGAVLVTVSGLVLLRGRRRSSRDEAKSGLDSQASQSPIAAATRSSDPLKK